VKILRFRAELCTGCGACEDACAKALFRTADREKAALRVEPDSAAAGLFMLTACNQCGECIEYCPAQAIYRAKNGVVRIKKERCVGCFSCVAFCPQGAMFTHGDLSEPFKCISCGSCVKACSVSALYLEELGGTASD